MNINKENNGTICWIDNLCYWSIFKVLILWPRCRFSEVRFVDFDAGCRWLIDSKLIGFLNLRNAFLAIDNVNAHDEMLSTNETYKAVTDFVYNSLELKGLLSQINEIIPKKYNWNKVDLYLKQQIAYDIEGPFRLFDIVQLSLERNPELHEKKISVLFKDNRFKKIIAPKKLGASYSIYTYPNFQEFSAYMLSFMKVLLSFVADSIFILFRKQKIKIDQQPKVAVFYTQGLDPSKKTDNFWFKDSNLSPQDLIIYFKYRNRALTPDIIKVLEAQNIPWVNLLPGKFTARRLNNCDSQVYFPNRDDLKGELKTLKQSLRTYRFCSLKQDPIYIFAWRHLSDLFLDIDLFESFFLSCNVKAHFALYEVGRDMSAANIAMDLVGGVDLSTHWSNYDVVNLQTGKPQDVYFAWGKHYTDNIFSQPYYQVKNYIYTGYPYDSFFDSCKKEAAGYRKNLQEHGAKFIISFFDQNVLSDRPLWNKELAAIYTRLFNLVINDKNIGLIIKPKKKAPGVKLPKLNPLIKKALATDRCLILPGSLLPNVAAQASDLAIGMAIGSTPSVEAALAGVPSIIYDPEKAVEHVFHNKGYQNIVFDNLDYMFERILKYSTGQVKEKFGDFSPIIDSIDSFRDGKAAYRIGSYIKWLLGEFKEGSSKEAAISKVNSVYNQEFGAKNINSVYIKTIENSLSAN